MNETGETVKRKKPSSPFDVGRGGVLIILGMLLIGAAFIIFTSGDNSSAVDTTDNPDPKIKPDQEGIETIPTATPEGKTNIISVSEVGETRIWYSVDGIPQKISSESADFVDIRTENNELKFSINSDIERDMRYRVDVIIVLYYEHPQLTASHREFERTLSKGSFSKDGRNIEVDLAPFTEIDYEGLEKMGMDRRYLRMKVEQMRFMVYR